MSALLAVFATMVLPGVILAALVIRANREPKRETVSEKIDRLTVLRACKGCGQHYHKNWGPMCPDCSGAD